MKKLFLTMLVAMVAMVSCEKSNLGGSLSGDTATVTISAEAATTTTTRALSDTHNVEGATLTYYVEVYLGEETETNSLTDEDLYLRLDPTTSTTVDVELLTGQTYTVLAWADYDTYDVANDGYYKTSDLKNVEINTYAINTTSRDAFSGKVIFDFSSTDNISVPLYRPFGRVNVTSTDENIPTDFAPKTVAVVYDNIYSAYNVLTGTVYETTKGEVTITATSTVDVLDGVIDGDLSIDYLFAPKDGGNVSFTQTYAGTGYETTYTFTDIPFKQNYQTNISGKILTDGGTITIDVTDKWTGEYLEGAKVFANADEYNAYINSTNVAGDAEFIITALEDGTHTLDVPSTMEATSITITVEEIGDAVTLNVGNGSEYAGTVNLVTPLGTYLAKLDVDLPEAHVTFLGYATESYSNTSSTTFVVLDGAIIGKIVVDGGNVDVYGTVDTVTRGDDNTDEIIVTIYDDGSAGSTDSDIDIEVYIEGNGTVEDPYQIKSAAQFSNLTGSSDYFILMNNIDLGGFDSEGTPLEDNQWTPVCDSYANSFAGDFDGQNFTVSGLYINSTSDYNGLIGWNGGVIYNLTIEGEITTRGYSGGLCYQINTGATVRNITSNVNISGTASDIGGIAGKNFGYMYDCINYGNLSSESSDLGGIAGQCSTSSVVDGCVNYGNVTLTVDGNYVGGIVGYLQNAGIVINCTNEGTITATIDPYSASDGNNIGGIVGYAKSGYISYCTNSGKVTSTGNNIGGISGNIAAGAISYCFNSADVYSTSTQGYAGGISGYITANTSNVVEVTNCANSGSITTVGGTSNGGAAGIVAYNCGVLSNCYNTGAITAEASSTRRGGIAYTHHPTYSGIYTINCYSTNNGTTGLRAVYSWGNSNVINSYYLATSDGSNSTSYGMPISATTLASQDFVDTLNANAESYNTSTKGEDDEAACNWKLENGIPVFDI